MGGTLALWRTQLDPYVKILPTTSTSALPLLLSIPGVALSAHIALYLPTSGREVEFISALADLEAIIENIREDYACPIYLRGDCNVNPKNVVRAEIFKHFCSKHALVTTELGHPTHHHFMGEGKFDAQLDLILRSGEENPADSVEAIICKLRNPLIQSHHDLIVTELPLHLVDLLHEEPVPVAPKVLNNRVKIKWNDDNIDHYQEIIGSNLSAIRERWAVESSPSSISILLSSTNHALSSAAKASNDFVKLGKPTVQKPVTHPEIRAAQLFLLRTSKHLHTLASNPSSAPEALASARDATASAKSSLRRISRKVDVDACYQRDSELLTILQNNPSQLFKSIKGMKSNSSKKIQKLVVAKKVFPGKHVPDGFFASLSHLKSPDMSSIHSSDSFKSTLSSFNHIMEICKTGLKIPDISSKDAVELLMSLRPDVNDLYSITARHYLHAGMEGVIHFSFLLNLIIRNVNLSSLEELNRAMILHKGHGKDRESDRSYRTISTCPFLSKALDKYVGSLYESGWVSAQAETQFQGTGSSHELAALLLTECINFSIYSPRSVCTAFFLMQRVHLTK